MQFLLRDGGRCGGAGALPEVRWLVIQECEAACAVIPAGPPDRGDLPYMKKRSLRRPNSRGKRPRGERRAMPAILVATPAEAQFALGKYAQAHNIRTRRGGYRYLV